MNATLRAARSYVAAGLSVIPVGLDGLKQPAFDVLPRIPNPERGDRFKASWKPYQERLATTEELDRWFGGRRHGIALVCGGISGGLECIDFDDKPTAREFLQEVHGEWLDLFHKLSLEDTPGGAHLWYRSANIPGNAKLALPARRECQRTGKPFKALIETRGEGGYAVTAGSPLEVHSLRLPYKHVGGPPLTQLATLTHEERDYLIRLAQSFDRSDQSSRHTPCAVAFEGDRAARQLHTPCAVAFEGDQAARQRHTECAVAFEGDRAARQRHTECAYYFDQDNTGFTVSKSSESPAADYDLRGEPFSELLPDAVFAAPGKDEGKVRRPGKERGVSATVGYCRGSCGEPLLKIFTTSWPPFEGGKCYGRFHVLRLTRFGGDGVETMRALRSRGFGSPNWKPAREGLSLERRLAMLEGRCEKLVRENWEMARAIVDLQEQLRVAGRG